MSNLLIRSVTSVAALSLGLGPIGASALRLKRGNICGAAEPDGPAAALPPSRAVATAAPPAAAAPPAVANPSGWTPLDADEEDSKSGKYKWLAPCSRCQAKNKLKVHKDYFMEGEFFCRHPLVCKSCCAAAAVVAPPAIGAAPAVSAPPLAHLGDEIKRTNEGDFSHHHGWAMA